MFDSKEVSSQLQSAQMPNQVPALDMKYSHPEFIYFDLGKVILEFDRERAYRQMSAVAKISGEMIRSILEDGGLQIEYETGNVTSQQFYERFCEAAGTRAPFESILEAGSNMFHMNIPMIPVVTQLAAANYRLGILSNTCEAHWQFCAARKFGIMVEAFDVHLLSYRVGAMKPDEQIYAAAAQSAGLEPEQIFFVDDISANVEAARQFGFDAVLYTTVTEFVRELRCRGVRFNY